MTWETVLHWIYWLCLPIQLGLLLWNLRVQRQIFRNLTNWRLEIANVRQETAAFDERMETITVLLLALWRISRGHR